VNMRASVSVIVAVFVVLKSGMLWAEAEQVPPAKQIIEKMLEEDPFGLAGAAVTAHMVLSEKGTAKSQLAFMSRSYRYDPPFAKSMVRFTGPPDMAGAGFLQVQNRSGDDDRYLFLPELKRSRRISGNLRATSFMGTDFSFADLDRRDFREAELVTKADDTVGKFPCYRVDVTPKRNDSPYVRIETWIRKENMLPLKLAMYDRSNTLAKLFTAQEVKRVSGKWFITKSRMLDNARSHSTDLVLDSVVPLQSVPEDEFTVRSLEKI
jgi:hypothetical protein